MEGDYKEADLEEYLESEIAAELGECLVYEASQRLEEAAQNANIKRNNVYQAFVNLGRIKAIWGKHFEELLDDIYKEAKKKLVGADFSEAELDQVAEKGLKGGELLVLPNEIGLDGINYGFVAETAMPEIVGVIRYVEGVGWQVLREQIWQRRMKEIGIVGVIYYVMRHKIGIWRQALERGGSVRGVGGWLEKLNKNVSDPEWLGKVEELFLRVDFFSVQIVYGHELPPISFCK